MYPLLNDEYIRWFHSNARVLSFKGPSHVQGCGLVYPWLIDA